MIGHWFKHYKGTNYMVVQLATHTETEEAMVIYCSQDNPLRLWARPLDMFMDTLEEGQRRFEPIPYDENGPTKVITSIELRQEAAVVVLDIQDGAFDVQFPDPLALPPRGELAIMPNTHRQYFKIEVERGRRSSMPNDFLKKPFEIRYSDESGAMFKLHDCQTDTDNPFRMTGTYDYGKSEFG